MAISIVGTPASIANGASYTAGAGSNRVVVDLCWNRRTGAVTLTNVLWNSVTRTPATTGADTASDDRSGTGISVFLESEIGAVSNATMTWGGTPSSQGQLPVTVQDVNQGAAIRNSVSGNGGTTAVSLTTSPTVGDLMLAVVVNRNGATYTINNGWTQLDTGTNGDGGRWVYLWKLAAGSSDDLSLTQNAGDGWQASAVVLAPTAGGGPTVRRNLLLGVG